MALEWNSRHESPPSPCSVHADHLLESAVKRPIVALLVSLPLDRLPVGERPRQWNPLAGLRGPGHRHRRSPEWAGVWTTSDSTYDCDGNFQEVSTSTDTVCGGERYSGDSIDFQCTGTATATSVNLTCTFSQDTLDCHFAYQSTIQGTLTGSTYRSVAVSSLTVTGSGPFCGFIPGYCDRIVTYGTRTGPAPATYCATPTTKTTWGRLKQIYR
mgnify:CR=1 FL=1